MTKPKPMQTHGLFDETWHPPVSRSKFVTYTKDDEHWLRPIGLGRVQKTIRNLFDVRLNDRTLVGYVDIDPTKSNRPWLHLPVILPSSVYDDPMLCSGRGEYRQVTMYVELLRVPCQRHAIIRLLDARIRTGRITSCSGRIHNTDRRGQSASVVK